MIQSAAFYTFLQVDIRIFKNGIYYYQCEAYEQLPGTIATPSTPNFHPSAEGNSTIQKNTLQK